MSEPEQPGPTPNVPEWAATPIDPAGEAAADAGMAAAPDEAGAATGDQGAPTTADEPARTRPAWLWPAVAGAAVLVVALVVVLVATHGSDDAAAGPVVTPTVVVPSPTPTVSPVARQDETAFTSALPTTVLQYALVSEKPQDGWIAAGALEAVTDTYGDGGSGQLVVDAGQWATAGAATSFAKSLLDDMQVQPTSPAAGLPQTGDVMAGGQKVGTFAVVDSGDGQGTAVWTNGTSVFRIVGPVSDVLNAYKAFPL
ncbi:hypothetical protein [Cellulomonas sp. HZM]|uniref:hypothetical protein n=1 Tax=Cellulomonas sp. HZM TaxID=1454010 RepID=UPI000492F890|nr:hypothetical protein [Cellulomonas sp. HZM]